MKIYTNIKTLTQPTATNNYEGYYEVGFHEYREDGTLRRTGSEDFSNSRFNKLKAYEIRKPSGRLNKNGRMMTEHFTYVRVSHDVTPKLLKKHFGEDITVVKL